MSYVPDMALDTRSSFQALDIPLQEALLDEIDRLTDDPSLVPPPLQDGRSIHAFPAEHEGEEHMIVLSLIVDHRKRTLAVIGIRHALP